MPIKKTTKKNPTKKAKPTEEDSTPAENSKTILEKDTQPMMLSLKKWLIKS